MEWHILNRENAEKFAIDLVNWTGMEVGHDEGKLHFRVPIYYHLIKRYVPALRTPEDTLPVLADEVADTICDTNTKAAFRKFANLLIEKLEKK